MAPRDEFQLDLDVEDALSLLGQLSERLRRIALLRALGLKQREIGELTATARRGPIS